MPAPSRAWSHATCTLRRETATLSTVWASRFVWLVLPRSMLSAELPTMPVLAGSGGCVDIPGWSNGHGKACADYAGSACVGGAFKPEFRWLAGEEFHSPELACCACGRQSHVIAPPPPPSAAMTVHGYELHITSYCRGADREVKKPSFAQCEEHCASRKCACAHFGNGMCRFGYTYLGLLRSHEGFSSMVRPMAAAQPAALKAAEREAELARTPAEQCGSSVRSHVPPTFYMYDGPEFMWGERLAACYTARNGHPPWAMATAFRNNTGWTEAGPAPQADLSHSLWLHASLVRHRHRTKDPSAAALFVVPAFGSLSEATGEPLPTAQEPTCDPPPGMKPPDRGLRPSLVASYARGRSLASQCGRHVRRYQPRAANGRGVRSDQGVGALRARSEAARGVLGRSLGGRHAARRARPAPQQSRRDRLVHEQGASAHAHTHERTRQVPARCRR